MLFFIFVKYVCETFPLKLIKLQFIDAKNDLYSCLKNAMQRMMGYEVSNTLLFCCLIQ